MYGGGEAKASSRSTSRTAGNLTPPDLFFNSSMWDWLSSFPGAKASSQQAPCHSSEEEGRCRMSLGWGEHLH